MNSLNSILLEGNLTADPKLTHTQKGIQLCNFTIASKRFFKQDNEYQKEISFFNITTWARLAEVCAEYLKKGSGVRIIGRLKQDRWKDADGTGKSRVYVVADNVEFKPKYKKDEKSNEKNY